MIAARDESPVSVVIPAYNAERYLAAAVESTLTQTYPPGEVLVVDDGSTDSTAEIARAFGPSVAWVPQPHAGLGAARNTGIQASSGALIAFLDADDLWTPEKLAWQAEVLEQHPDVDIVFGAVRQFSGDDLDSHEGFEVRTGGAGSAICASAMLARRTAFDRVGLFSEDYRTGEFLDWFSRALEGGLRQVTLDRIVFYRRLHDSNMGRDAGLRTEYLRVLRDALRRRRSGSQAS